MVISASPKFPFSKQLALLARIYWSAPLHLAIIEDTTLALIIAAPYSMVLHVSKDVFSGASASKADVRPLIAVVVCTLERDRESHVSTRS